VGSENAKHELLTNPFNGAIKGRVVQGREQGGDLLKIKKVTFRPAVSAKVPR